MAFSHKFSVQGAEVSPNNVGKPKDPSTSSLLDVFQSTSSSIVHASYQNCIKFSADCIRIHPHIHTSIEIAYWLPNIYGKVKDPKKKDTYGKKGGSSVQGGEEVSEMKKKIVDVTKDKRTSFSLHDLPSDAPSDDPENDDLEDVSPSEPEGTTLQLSPPRRSTTVPNHS